jgi:glycosyltransferase involved in cell wall biosynthesis
MSTPLRILWLKTGPLHPLDTGGKLRTYHMLRELAKTHTVTFLALCPPETSPDVKAAAAEYSQRQVWVPWQAPGKGSPQFYASLAGNFFQAQPYVISRYHSPAMIQAIQEETQSARHDLVVCDFLTPAVNLFSPDAPAAKTLLFQHNVESQIWQRLYQNQTNAVKRFYFRLQWQRLRHFEAQASARFDGVVAVSDEDAAIFKQEFGLGNVLGSVPTGVDVEHFASVPKSPQPGNLAFLGSMDWMPNTDATVWFVAEIFPLVKKSCPNATFTIIGRNPPEKIKALAAQDPAIRVTGTVADVRPHLAQAEAMLVPLRVGGGTRIKIYEAMAAGIPVVSTRIGAEGLKVAHEENILLADRPEDFAQETIRLLQHPDLRELLSTRAHTLVRDHFGWASVARVFETYCRQVAG